LHLSFYSSGEKIAFYISSYPFIVVDALIFLMFSSVVSSYESIDGGFSYLVGMQQLCIFRLNGPQGAMSLSVGLGDLEWWGCLHGS